MRYGKLSYIDVAAAVEDRDDSRWSCEHDGYTIDVDIAEVGPERWGVNVSVRVAGWTDNLCFTSREAARVTGERIGIRFIDDLTRA